jgi:6-phosphogluconolactonase
MPRKAGALMLVCVIGVGLLSCYKTSSNFLYAALPTASVIDSFREDPNSGVLTILAQSPVTAGPGVQALVVHPSKQYLYAANSGENDVSLFTIASNGYITEVPPRTLVGVSPTLLVIDSAGQYLYVGNAGSNTISSFSISSTNGTLTPVSTLAVGISPLNMKLAPSGSYLYVTGSGLPGVVETLSVNAGVLTLTQVTDVQTNPYGLAINPAGTYLYVANAAPDDSLAGFSIGSDGTLTQLTGTPFGEGYSSPVSLLVDKSGSYLYVANQGSSNVSGYSIGSDGSLSLLASSPWGTNKNPNVIATDPGGTYLFVGNLQQGSAAGIQSFTLSSSNGALTAFALDSISSTPTSLAVTP